MNWNHLDNPAFGAIVRFSESIAALEGQRPDLLPNFRACPRLTIGSDYSGDTGSEYRVFCYILADHDHCGTWESMRRRVRDRYLAGRGEMAYKCLNDRARNNALEPFLHAANYIPGVAVVFVMTKEISSFFDVTGKLNMAHPDFSRFKAWKPKTFERMLRVVHLASVLVAGLSSEGQTITWVTDHDDVIANEDRRNDFLWVWGEVQRFYSPHPLAQLVLRSSEADEDTHSFIDWLAVPDLIAGAFSEYYTRLRHAGRPIVSETQLPPPPDLSEKTKRILYWFSDVSTPLRRLVCVWNRVPPAARSGITTETKNQLHCTNFADYRVWANLCGLAPVLRVRWP